jgi:hypothetical protein
MPDPQAPAAKDSTSSDALGAKPERVAIQTPKVNAPHVTITRPNVPSSNGSKNFQSFQEKDQSFNNFSTGAGSGKNLQSKQNKD